MDPVTWLRHPTRSRILDAAERCFAELGFDATTIDDVLDVAEVSRSHLYYHFPAKAALLTGLARLRAAELAETELAWPDWIARFRPFIRVAVVEHVLRPQVVATAWTLLIRNVPDGLDAEGELVRAAADDS